jgi:hypothetical protein
MAHDFGIQGVILASEAAMPPPHILVIGPEKVGKSTTIGKTLLNWPYEGAHPLFISIDRTGVQACRDAGFDPPHLPIDERLGPTTFERVMAAADRIETALNRAKPPPITSLIIDCGSTLGSLLFQDSRDETLGGKKQKDPRKNYGEVLEQAQQIMWRIMGLGLPTFWLSWEKPGFVEEKGSGAEKTRKTVLGGANITGNFKVLLSGKVDQIIVIRKRKVGKAAEGADRHGFIRQFHTQQVELTDAGGRFSLPNPMVADAGLMLNMMYYSRGFSPPGVDAAYWDSFAAWMQGEGEKATEDIDNKTET